MNRVLMFFLVVAVSRMLSAQPVDTTGLTNVSNLCYDEEYTEHIRIPGDLNTSTLTVLDKLKFLKKQYSQGHHEYINGNGHATHDRSFVSHENMFPKWYSPPSLLRNDETGVTSYFTTNNEYLTDGWTGGVVSTTQHGAYITDGETGQHYYQEDYSTLASQFYNEHDHLAQSIGFLYKSVFSAPDSTALGMMEHEGYQTTFEGNVITVQNTSKTLIWDLDRKVSVNQVLEGEKVVKTTHSYYTFQEAFGSYLIGRTVTVVPGTFENGDCFETVTETKYTNYAMNCNQSGIQRKDNQGISSFSGELSLHPNPGDNLLTLRFPSNDLSGTVILIDLSGNLAMQRKVAAQSNKYEIDVSDLPAGMYIVKMQQGDDILTSKFVKK